MLKKHQSHGLIDLIKMSSSSPLKREEVKLPMLNTLSQRKSANMVVKAPVKKFDSEIFNNKFNQLGKDIKKMELKTRNFEKTMGRNGKYCENAFSNMGNLNSDNNILKFAEVLRKIQVLEKEFLVNDIMDIQKFKKHEINLVLMEID